MGREEGVIIFIEIVVKGIFLPLGGKVMFYFVLGWGGLRGWFGHI